MITMILTTDKSIPTWTMYSDATVRKAGDVAMDKADFIQTDAFYFDRLEFNSNKNIVIVTPQTRKYLFAFSNEGSQSIVQMNKIDLTQYNIICADKQSLEAAKLLLRLIDNPLSLAQDVLIDAKQGLSELDSRIFANAQKKKTIYFTLAYKFDKKLFDVLNESTTVSILDYGDHVNSNELQLNLPYSRIEAIDIRVLMPKKTQFTKILKLITFDTLVYGKDPLSNVYIEKATGLRKSFIAKGDLTSKEAISTLNFYEMIGFKSVPSHPHLGLANVSSQEHFSLSNNNAELTDGELSHQIKKIKLTAGKHMPGTLTKSIRDLFKEYKILSKDVLGVIIKRGDVIELVEQPSKIENGQYFVFKTFDNYALLQTSMMLKWNASFMNIHDTSSDKKKYVVKIMLEAPELRDYNGLYDVGSPVYITELDMGGFISAIDKVHMTIIISDDLKALDSTFRCTNPLLASQWACKSDFDAFGEKKQTKDRWDRPCVWDDECPFWTVHKKGGYRGGCDNGYCEMPLNVNRIGYRKYELSEKSFPYCHGCDIHTMKECCAEKQHSEYAFELDFLNNIQI